MRKKMLCLAMTMVMAVGMSSTVYAVDYVGDDGWRAEFDGDSLNSNFESGDIADTASGVQPGDSIEMHVQVANTDSTETDWYMTNEVVQTLEDAASQASGGAYEYRLVYTDPAGEENVLYDSSSVGGETNGEGGEGLHQVGDTTEEYFYLGRLEQNQTGDVSLWVKVDGETQGNGYQQTLAELRMNFAVEEVAEGTAAPSDNDSDKETVVKKVVKTIKTGDTTNVLLFSIAALVSGIVLFILGVISFKNRRRKGARRR